MRTSRILIAFLLVSAVHAQVTAPVPPVTSRQVLIAEDFTSASRLDVLGTGALWGGGRLLPEVLGGRGIHGDFVASDGRYIGRTGGVDVYEWSTDNQLIPAARTLLGTSVTVTNGVFEFTSFVLPTGQKVVFKGTNPAQIRVVGLVLIQGELDASAPLTAEWDGKAVGNSKGQPSGSAGPGGGLGGAGGDRPTVVGRIDGSNGVDVVLAAGHPYFASRIGTGGGGSLAHPPGANPALLQDRYLDAFCQNLAAGGAGGSLNPLFPGTAGRVVVINANCTNGPASAPGAATLQLLPEVNGVSSLLQFLAGGSGGGGAGINPYFNAKNLQIAWNTGAAGAGGGGAVALSAGGGIGVFPGGVLAARGGSAANPRSNGYADPGGGGSGGSILLQALRFFQAGSIDLSGGKGGTWTDSISTPGFGFLSSAGGNGGAGYLRLESIPRPAVASLGAVIPPAALANTGLLRDSDPASGARSLWYTARSTQAQSWVRFTIDAVVNGVPTVFSDDPAYGQQPGLGTTPVVFFLQGAMVDLGTLQPQPNTSTPWVQQTSGLSPYPTNGFRWVVLLDRGVLGGGVPIEVRRVAVWLQ